MFVREGSRSCPKVPCSDKFIQRTAKMPAVNCNGVGRFHQGTTYEGPQYVTASWRNEGEDPFSTQKAIICSPCDWDDMVEQDVSLLAWATSELRDGLLLAISPARLVRRLGVIAENGSLGL
jgi:hypothetical protein